MAEIEQPLNLRDIMSLINTANKTLEHDVYIPSLNKEIHLKTLNANHTKHIAKAAIEGAFSQNQFTMTMYTILKDICDPSVPLSKMNTYDKTLICLALRSKNISDMVTVTGESETGKESDITVNISDILTVHRANAAITLEDIEVTFEGQTVYLNYPTIEEEYQFEAHLYNTRIVNVNEKDPASMKAMFGPLFINTIAQYIKAIKINDKLVNLSTRKISDRLDIFEIIPSKLTREIIRRIDEVFGKEMAKLLTLEQAKEDGEIYTGSIEINPSLFLI